MNKTAFVEVSADQEWKNVNCFLAFDGFKKMDFNVVKARDIVDIEEWFKDNGEEPSENCLAVGSVKFVKEAMEYFDVSVPDPLDYPDCLDFWYD